MCNGGRIVHHLKNYLPGKNNTLLFVSYLAVGSLGRLLNDGERVVNIMGKKFGGGRNRKNRRLFVTRRPQRLARLCRQIGRHAGKSFRLHGELKSSSFLVQRLRDYLGVSAVAPRYGETQEIEI